MPSHAEDGQQPILLFISEIEAMGGAERSILALGRWLYQHQRRVALLTYRDGVNVAAQADYPLHVIELQPGPGLLAKVRSLRKHLATRTPGAPPLMASGYQPALHCALARAGRFHCLMHDTPSLFAGDRRSLQQRLRLAVSNWLIGSAMRRGGGQMIVTSEFLQRECRHDFGVNAAIARMGGLGGQHVFRRRAVVPSALPQPDPHGAVDTPRPATDKDPAKPQLNLLSVCRIEANKRIDWILEALAALEQGPKPLSSRADWRLDLSGTGSQLEAMRDRAAQLGLAARVHFHGFVPDHALEDLYDRAHLFLMPAVQGYGIPAIEALARGIPVLLHRESGVSDILLDTPWASVLTDGKEELTPRLATTLDWLLRNEQMSAPPPPDLPTEDAWAERVATLCGYV